MLEKVVALMAFVIALAIVFVRAGQATPAETGGQQTALIVSSSGGALSQVISSIEGNAVTAQASH